MAEDAAAKDDKTPRTARGRATCSSARAHPAAPRLSTTR